MTYLPDTDIVNYIIKRREPTLSRFEQATADNAHPLLSPVVHFEVAR